MKNKIGTNQYRIKHKHFLGVFPETWASIWFVIAVTAILIPIVKPKITSPCPDDGCFVKTVYAKESKPELQELVDYILQVFAPAGRSAQVHALTCFASESGLRPDAHNHNANGTEDYGPAQVNSVHIKRFGQGFVYDWRANIRVAFQIYQASGWSAWYGKYCN